MGKTRAISISRMSWQKPHMSVLHLDDIRKMIRGIATPDIIPDYFGFGNPKRRGAENPIDAVAPGPAVKIMLRGRFVAFGVEGPPGVHEAAARTGQFLKHGLVRGLIEVTHQDQRLVFFLEELPNKAGPVKTGRRGDVVQVGIAEIKPQVPA